MKNSTGNLQELYYWTKNFFLEHYCNNAGIIIINYKVLLIIYV
jgi:hypothetical protein